MGQFASTAGCAEWFSGVAFADSFAVAVAEEAAEAGKSSGDGGACVAAFVEPRDIAAEDCGIDLGGVRDATGVFLEEFPDVCEVIGVGLDGQFGCISFDFKEAEESLDGRIHGDIFEDVVVFGCGVRGVIGRRGRVSVLNRGGAGVCVGGVFRIGKGVVWSVSAAAETAGICGLWA